MKHAPIAVALSAALMLTPAVGAQAAPADHGGAAASQGQVASSRGAELRTMRLQVVRGGYGDDDLIVATGKQPVTVDRPEWVPAAIGGAAIAAAAWCAKGVLGSVPTSALEKALTGETNWVRNAVIGCLVGNVGSWVWGVVGPRVRNWAISAVIAILIRMS